jgi:mycothiol synthase
MLLNPVLNRQSMEVVYLGLARPWRRQGLGRKLMMHAISLARQERIKSLILAVDENNRPAVRLYESLQFTPTARKQAMVCAMQAPSG